MNNLAPMKNCPGGVQGNLNWMPEYKGGNNVKGVYFHWIFYLVKVEGDI